jgi:hypothetical protein
MWTLTNEGATQHGHCGDNAVEFFSKAGSAFQKKQSFYANEVDILKLFEPIFNEDQELAFKLALWVRDCRGGAGNRSGARKVLLWIAKNYPNWVELNLKWIPEVGRWDDLRCLFATSLKKRVAAFWADAIKSNNQLAAKWADRSDVPIRQALGLTIGDFRRLLAKIRKDGIVEHKMCQNAWGQIIYNHVPSVAMARYTKAFAKHDPERFVSFKEAVKKGEVTIKADVLFPHDCVRTAQNGDREIADAQFEALPNFMSQDELVMVLSDTSGSMNTQVAGSVRAIDVSQGLALYCSAKMPEASPFYKRFLGFCSEASFKDWRGMSFSQAVNSSKIFDGAVGSTRIDTALNWILKFAKEKEIPQIFMPSTLMIVSDMQFSAGGAHQKSDGKVIDACLKKWEEAGYKIPRILYWNLSQYAGSPEKAVSANVGLISGFSTAILKAVFSGTDFSPRAIMLRALEKYSEVVVPR